MYPTTSEAYTDVMLDYTLPNGMRIRDMHIPEAHAAIQAAAKGSIRDTNVYASRAVIACGGSVMDYIQYQLATMGVGETVSM